MLGDREEASNAKAQDSNGTTFALAIKEERVAHVEAIHGRVQLATELTDIAYLSMSSLTTCLLELTSEGAEGPEASAGPPTAVAD
eukprot:8051211-Pyramimonas_sp.AAC.1